MSADYSRTELLASGATAVEGDLLRHLKNEVVIVSSDPDPAMVRAARILLTTLRRLPIILTIDGEGLDEATVRGLADAVVAVDPAKPLEQETAGFRIHIGRRAPDGVLRVVPSRHGAHVLHDGRVIVPAPASALGSAMAAAFAAAEVFKHVVQVRDDRRSDQSYAFCPVTLTDEPERAPALDRSLKVAGALLGIGAIGTATAMILGELDAVGSLDVVDRQRYGRENVTTYSLGGMPDASAEVWKTALATDAMKGIDCTSYNEEIETYLGRVQRVGIAPPRLVVAGLDNVEARHTAQRLWPDLLIDGATGDTMLGLHVVRGAGQPCMECFLPKPTSGPSPYEKLSALTGLAIEKLRNGDEILRDEDLVDVDDEQRVRLAPHVGKKICGLADGVGLTDLKADGFMPSAAFVSLAAGCLVVGCIVAMQLGIEPQENFVQYDALFGPVNATIEKRSASVRCYCVERAGTIARVRSRGANSVVRLS